MTYKQINAAHELRMWISQVIIPAASMLYVVYKTNPDIAQRVNNKIETAKFVHSIKHR